MRRRKPRVGKVSRHFGIGLNIFLQCLGTSASHLQALDRELKSHWIQISRIARQVRKIENPETSPKNSFREFFSKILFRFFNVVAKFAKKRKYTFLPD